MLGTLGVSGRKLPAVTSWLTGGGEMGVRIREFDWSDTAIGPMENWSPTLRIMVRFLLANRFPLLLWWGPDYVSIYNDAYCPVLGDKHPWGLGKPVSECWSEIWHVLKPLIDTPFHGGPATWNDDIELEINRHGFQEETHFTIAYSAVPDEAAANGIGGVLATVTEITGKVVGERRTVILRDLAARTGEARTPDEACTIAAETLGKHAKDVPFALLYLLDSDRKMARLAAAAGVKRGEALCPELVTLKDALEDEGWNLHATTAPLIVNDLQSRFPGAPSTSLTHTAVVLPIAGLDQRETDGFLVVGVNPRLNLDEHHHDFLQLMKAQVASAIANARSHEEKRKRAESLAEIDRAKTVFFSNVSHEFRTPLTLMLGNIEDMLSSEGVNPDDRDRLAIAHRNSLRLLKLVNSLLEFSRIEAGRVQAVFEPADLAAATGELASVFRSATEKAGLKLTVDAPPLPELAYVDRQMWEKIILNLLSNAFKFTFEGEIGVRVRERGPFAEVVVFDTGTGISESELPHLFERFHRIEGAKGRSFEGSGIGLALVKELVELQGGTIRAESREGEGSAFTISLPFGKAHIPAKQIRGHSVPSTGLNAQLFVDEAIRWLPEDVRHATPSETASLDLGDTSRPNTKRATVLIADDNADMRGYLARLIGARHDCLAVSDGLQALDVLRKRRVDLLLTDIMMPGMDGVDLIKAVRADAKLRDLPVIVLSARAGEEARVEGFASGANDYLPKPFSSRELVARVDGAIALQRTRREMGEALREEAHSLEILNRVGATVAAELDLERTVQIVTDAAKELTGAAFGSFFYNVVNDKGESYMLYALSGVPREAFSKFPMPRNTAIFAPTFGGEGIVRSDDILKDPRYGKNEPHRGMPKGHLPVRSYLAAPVVSRSGEVLGGLFFGHPDVGVFTARSEWLVKGIAAQAAIAIDNARLYKVAQTLNQSLEAKVAERTEKLSIANRQLVKEAKEREKVEAALRQSQKMEAVGKLTGGVAHDFNNLLQVIGGNLQLLYRDVGGNEKAEQRVRNALAGVSRGSKLAAQLLAFGRRHPLAPKVVNLGRFVRSLDDLLRRALGDGIEIETVISGGLWNTHVDPSQVENAILNLAINARDAMNGHGRLTIEAGNASLTGEYAVRHDDVKPGQYVMLAVTDTGCGIAPDIIDHVFEPFFTTKPEGQGTGLGLSMVYGFVKQSGGHTKIYSEVRHGTTVRMYLPRVVQAEDIATETDTGPIAGGNETILVVEDDEDVRSTVVELFADLGYRVLRAKDAQSALAIVESGVPIDLLFTDVVMPGPIRSLELARKTVARLPSAGVLFTSGYTGDAIVHGGQLDQDIELLSKPYTREALARRVRQVLRNRPRTPDENPVSVNSTAADATLPAAPRILVVEDEVLIRLSTAEILSSGGYAVLEAANGSDALRILGETPVDVMVVDVGLPDISGEKLVALARKKAPGLRAIYATGKDGISSLANEDRGTTALVRKPYRAETLIDTISALLGKHIPSPGEVAIK